MTDRILKCLDLCEASNLFDAGDVDANRQAIAHGLLLRPLPVKPSHPTVRLAFHRDGTLIEVAGSRVPLHPRRQRRDRRDRPMSAPRGAGRGEK